MAACHLFNCLEVYLERNHVKSFGKIWFRLQTLRRPNAFFKSFDRCGQEKGRIDQMAGNGKTIQVNAKEVRRPNLFVLTI